MLYVCSLSRLAETVGRTGASHMVTLINAGTPVERPPQIHADRHLFLGFNDITAPAEGLVPPAEEHVRHLIDFTGKWDRNAPMVIHCWAGISRSTAGAFITACSLMPERDEMEIALALRGASPSATPNARLVALADDVLERRGRMVDAVTAIGRGADAFEGEPFSIEID